MSDERGHREELERKAAEAERTSEPSSEDVLRTGDGAEARDDEAWLERMREVYAPPPMSPTERRAFDARLEERIEAESQRGPFGLRLWQPIAVAAVAAAAAWLAFAPSSDPTPELVPAPTEFASSRTATSLADWEREILAAAEPTAGSDVAVGEDILPDDYRAIAGLFLDDDRGATAHAP